MEKMGRRAFIARAAALAGAGALLLHEPARASEALDPEILKSQLYVKTELEGAFVDDVVAMTRKGTLPAKILASAYRYALTKDSSHRVIYFKKCLEILTKRTGLRIKFKDF